MFVVVVASFVAAPLMGPCWEGEDRRQTDTQSHLTRNCVPHKLTNSHTMNLVLINKYCNSQINIKISKNNLNAMYYKQPGFYLESQDLVVSIVSINKYKSSDVLIEQRLSCAAAPPTVSSVFLLDPNQNLDIYTASDQSKLK